jgi:hypothetical protein
LSYIPILTRPVLQTNLQKGSNLSFTVHTAPDFDYNVL